MLIEALAENRKIILEGAQGSMLDIDHGTYPFVTSSSPTVGGASIGLGISPRYIQEIAGVYKAYTTRVGSGPFPTELTDEVGDAIRERAWEYGTTTGRPRRCGWFDAVNVKRACRLSGVNSLCVTKLDVLDTLPEISIATAYRTPEGEVREFPADTWQLGEAEPIYETLPGWEAPTGDVRKLADLPAAARRYLDRIEELTVTPVQMVSVGTRRKQIIRV